MSGCTIIYSDNKEPFKGLVKYENLNATANYLKHYNNYKTLQFFEQRGSNEERFQAAKELKTCQRKLDWWMKHPNYDQNEVATERARIDSLWNS